MVCVSVQEDNARMDYRPYKYRRKTIQLAFYGDLVYKFKRIVGKPNFSDQWVSCDSLHAWL